MKAENHRYSYVHEVTYQVLTPDQVKMEDNPAYQILSSHSGRTDVSKQKPAGNVDYYEDTINDQNISYYDRILPVLFCSQTIL